MVDIKRRDFLKLCGAGVSMAALPATLVFAKDAEGIPLVDLDERIEAKKGTYLYNEAKREIVHGRVTDMHAQFLGEPPHFSIHSTTMKEVRAVNLEIADPVPIVQSGKVCGACFNSILSDHRIGGVVVYSERTQVPFIFCPLVPMVPSGGDFMVKWEQGLFEIVE